LRAAEEAGFRAAICLTGHYGGIEVDMKQVCELYSKRRPMRAIALADWEAMRYKKYAGDHAGFIETSQLWALRPELVDVSRLPETPYEGRLFAAPHDAKKADRREGEEIVKSQIGFLKRLADELLRQAATQPPSERISWDKAESIWQEMLADRANWISSHPAEGFWEYLKQRRTLFCLPIN
jgi:creatinine amidohydrolase